MRLFTGYTSGFQLLPWLRQGLEKRQSFSSAACIRVPHLMSPYTSAPEAGPLPSLLWGAQESNWVPHCAAHTEKRRQDNALPCVTELSPQGLHPLHQAWEHGAPPRSSKAAKPRTPLLTKPQSLQPQLSPSQLPQLTCPSHMGCTEQPGASTGQPLWWECSFHRGPQIPLAPPSLPRSLIRRAARPPPPPSHRFFSPASLSLCPAVPLIHCMTLESDLSARVSSQCGHNDITCLAEL